MSPKAATIRDIAAHAGVGISTVSYVLNGHDQHVSAATRARVLASVQALNYRPNAIARSMITRATATIGLVINELQNSLFVPVIGGVSDVLRTYGYHIVLASAPDLASEQEAIETLRRQQVDGFIFTLLSLAYPEDHLQQLHREGVPFVVINRQLAAPEITQILLDDYGAGYQATSHLISLGHQRIGIISGPILDQIPRWSARERQRGWQDALTQHNLPADPAWRVVSDYTIAGGYQAARQLLEQLEGSAQQPTALFIASDEMAEGALKAFADTGVSIPQTLAVITIGDPPIAAYTIPALTTLALPVTMAGQVAAQLLVDWLSSGNAPQPSRIMLPFQLQIRESCGARLITP